jgi:GTPase SAR1 family protein
MYRGANAVVLVYDVTKESSLRALEVWLDELEVHGVGRDVPRILVGNKCDEERQQVPTAAAQRWADDR